jgi:ubiquinone/menaquinone biosynthesis C-methylase UbiE
MATGTAASLAAEAATLTARDFNSAVVSDHDDLVRASFDRQVGLFSGPDSPFVRRPAGTVEQLEPLDDSMLVLDLCCGAAHAAEVVAPRVRQVVGVDLTVALLELGAARLAGAGVSNVLLQEGNAQALPFVADSFDLVYCFASLHHVGDPAAAVAEMARVCVPGGRIVLQDLVVPVPAARERFDAVHRRLDPSHRRAHLEAELVALLPPDAELTYAATTESRLPISIAYTEQSDVDGAESELRAELAGGPVTGLEPAEEGGTLTVSFWTSTLQATLPAPT